MDAYMESILPALLEASNWAGVSLGCIQHPRRICTPSTATVVTAAAAAAVCRSPGC
jgi:hypothetical protein